VDDKQKFRLSNKNFIHAYGKQDLPWLPKQMQNCCNQENVLQMQMSNVQENVVEIGKHVCINIKL